MPKNPATDVVKTRIFHITHVKNLASIISDGCLWSDRQLAENQTDRVVIGLNNIKQRRMNEQWVTCHPGTRVGDFVPFYYCPRSPMLHRIHMKCDDLEYQEGQEDVVHLVSTIEQALAHNPNQRVAFTDINAGIYSARFFHDLSTLNNILDWNAINATWWSGPNVDRSVMPKKMAEFLIHGCFAWTGILGIGVINNTVETEVKQILQNAEHQPRVAVVPDWYY